MNRVGRKTREGARGEGREGGRKIGIWMDNLDGGEIVYRLGEVFSFSFGRGLVGCRVGFAKTRVCGWRSLVISLPQVLQLLG